MYSGAKIISSIQSKCTAYSKCTTYVIYRKCISNMLRFRKSNTNDTHKPNITGILYIKCLEYLIHQMLRTPHTSNAKDTPYKIYQGHPIDIIYDRTNYYQKYPIHQRYLIYQMPRIPHSSNAKDTSFFKYQGYLKNTIPMVLPALNSKGTSYIKCKTIDTVRFRSLSNQYQLEEKSA